MGRPSIYNEDLATTICERIADGETLINISNDPTMPHKSQIMRWVHSEPGFREQYASARTIQIMGMPDRMVSLAMDPTKHTDKLRQNQTRLEIDVLKWYCSKVVPKVPTLAGALSKQIDQVVDSLNKQEISVDTSELMLKMIAAKAQLMPVDELKQEMAEIKEMLKSKT